MRSFPVTILISMLVLGACGGKKKDDQAKDQAAGKGGAATGGDASAAAAEASALVPAELQAKLQFTTAKGEDDLFVAVVPAGWTEAEHMPGRYKPADDSLGFMSSFSVGSNCDGSCAPKDWVATTDKVEFKQFTEGGQFTVEKDEKAEGKRLLVVKTDDSVYVVVARWKEGASRYFVCRATLDKELSSTVAAFTRACEGMAISSW